MRAALLLAGTATMTMGCLVTEQVEFKAEPNFPPSIISRTGAPSPRSIAVLVPPGAAGLDAGPMDNSTTELVFEVFVQDPNVKQDLEVLQIIDGETPVQVLLAPQGDNIRREFNTDPIRAADLRGGRGCHRFELLVSRHFVFGTVRPEDQFDVASMVWWFRYEDRPSDETLMGGCPTL